MQRTIIEQTNSTGALPTIRKRDWDAEIRDGRLHYHDGQEHLWLPLPTMAGRHQADNAALAVAMLKHQSAISVPHDAMAKSIQDTSWPARMQLLGKGPLTNLLPQGSAVWLDGGHNPDAGAAIAMALESGPPIHVVIGMLKNKDALGFLKPFAHKIASLHAVPIPGHEHHDPKDLCWWVQDSLGITFADPVDNVTVAVDRLAANNQPMNVLICGSLYLAGEVLRANDQVPG